MNVFFQIICDIKDGIPDDVLLEKFGISNKQLRRAKMYWKTELQFIYQDGYREYSHPDADYNEVDAAALTFVKHWIDNWEYHFPGSYSL